jgi:REP element-mobilizing transposase RayT
METVLFHVTSRGNNRAIIFVDDVDYQTFLRMLGDVASKRGWVRHAYCLIPNHYHLLIEVPELDLARGMQLLNGRYARRFNQRHGRDGHVFAGPYFAKPVERDEHVVEASRYIVLNPVRAGLCTEPGEWPWSSYSDVPTPLVRELLGDRSHYEAFVLAAS